MTRIAAAEQVAYRLSEQAGCFVVSPPQQGADAVEDQVVDYRMRGEGRSSLVWMGAGLEDVGLVAGKSLDEEGKEAARLLMSGCDPRTGARLVPAELRTHPDAQLTGARLVEAFTAAADTAGVEPAALLEGKPKQQRQLATLTRMVNRFGEAHRVQVDTLHRLARAAGIDLADVYGADELAAAHAHQEERVDNRVRGWDLVADLPKSDSTLYALLDSLDAEDLAELVHQAKREAFAELEDWIGYGVGSKDGRRVRLAVGGLMAWSVEHQSARPVDDTPGDPHLHLHLVIPNLALCEDGKWRSIANSGQDLHRHARAFDGLFKARVRALTYERFGVRRELDTRTGAWEVAGIPVALRAAFSRRAAAVDAKAGADASRADKQRISAATRHAKHDTGALDIRTDWRRRAGQLVDVDAMVAAAAPGPPGPDGGLGASGPGRGPVIPPAGDLAAVVFDPHSGLTAHEKEFSRAQLLAAVAHALPYGIGPESGALEALADEVLAVEGYAVPLPHRGSTVMSSTARFTTADVLQAERTLVDQARARHAAGVVQLTGEQAGAAVDVFEVAAGYRLSDQQRAAVVRLLTAGHGVEALIGVAGAGKTTLMQACRIGWDATGRTHAGAALSAVAAQGLQEGSGIPSRTVASWLQRIEDGPGLAGVDVLVVDEATMVDDRTLATLLIEAERSGTKVVCVGDPQQLQAVGVGGGFAEVHRLVGGQVLTENRRQRDLLEQSALETWRTGEREEALQLLADGGRVHAAWTVYEAHAGLIAAWDAVRAQWPDPHELLDHLVVLAARNTDVDVLNLAAQAIRRSAGELGTEHTFALPGGQRLTLAVGDVVRVRQNDYRSRRGDGPDLLNGYRAVVTDVDDQQRVRITWRGRAAGEPELHSAWLTPAQVAGGAVSLGYAMTIAASQGMTTHTALTYGHGANASALYPGITRAKEANHLWLPTAALEDDDTRARLGAARSEREQLERAVAAYARLLRQDRPDGMVSDRLRTPPTPAAADPAPRREQPQKPSFPAWHDRTVRPYGRLSPAELESRLAQHLELADAAVKETNDHVRALNKAREEVAANPGRAVASQCEDALREAEGHARTADVEQARADRARARADEAREHREMVAAGADRGRLALRLAGTSRKEQRTLLDHLDSVVTRERAEQRAAQKAAKSAETDAWAAVKDSGTWWRFAETGSVVTAIRPEHLQELRERLDAMRRSLPAIEARATEEVAARVRVHEHGGTQSWRSWEWHCQSVDALRAEQALRARIAQADPALRAQEMAERTAAARKAAEQQRKARPRHPEPLPHQRPWMQPAPGRGPGLGL